MADGMPSARAETLFFDASTESFPNGDVAGMPERTRGLWHGPYFGAQMTTQVNGGKSPRDSRDTEAKEELFERLANSKRATDATLKGVRP